ncbi:MAG: glycosyltransferase [Brachybacterium sp.]|uniref:glycosyltransferase n=1 Tax=Brachybacterium sp. TaxID=1891286 RepID=UPI002649B22B|nr:glycosyltransferase [Brachybacterium sp.]MDN5686361.1 glycosyltransferase [Brachybacterium sp.]
MPSPRQAARNTRLLIDAAVQHLRDDPALLVIQISRRLPMAVRTRGGRLLLGAGRRVPRGRGPAALGAVMAGETARAEALVEAGRRSRSRLLGEVAVMLDRMDLVPHEAPAGTRARAAWARGDLDGALSILEASGRGDSAQARRLRSERELLDPETCLRVPLPAPHAPRSAPESQLRVLHLITNSLPHTQSGYALRTHHILTSLRGHGIDSLALTRTGYPVMVGKFLASQEDVVDRIHYRRTLPARLGATPRERLEQRAEEAMRLVAQFRPHVIHATTDYRNALVAQVVSDATGVPWVYEVRGLMEQTWIASHPRPEGRAEAAASQRAALTAAREGQLAAAAAGVVTLGGAMASALVERGVSATAIELVPNGVDETLLAETLDVHTARQAVGLDLPDSAFVVGGVSAVVPYEGHEVLLRAAAALVRSPETPAPLRDCLHLVIVGDGTAAPALHTLARELGIEDRVHLPGRVPRQQARQWVQAMDVVAVPRLDLEVTRSVTPQKPVEAMALGRPVIVSDLPAVRETVTDADGEVRAELVPAEDPAALAAAIHGLWVQPERREVLAEAGHTLARERTWPALMRRYAAMYQQAMNETTERTTGGH